MRVCLVVEHFDGARGGAEAVTVWLASQLVARGHEVHVVCHDVGTRINRYRAATQRASHHAQRSQAAKGERAEPQEGVTVHTVGGVKLSSGLGFLIFGARARAACRRIKPDVVHSSSVAYAGDIYHLHSGVYVKLHMQAVASRTSRGAARLKQVMLAISSKQQTLLRLERKAMRPVEKGGVRKLISLSPRMTADLREIHGVSAERICELPNPRLAGTSLPDEGQMAADRAWFRSHYQLGETDRAAIFVGHDFRRKGLRYAIEAIARTRDWKLVVVGLGKAREYLELAARLGLNTDEQTRVKFLGPTQEVERIYAGSDALLLPTFYEGFALVTLEAMSFGLPVISTVNLGADYIVTENGAGTIVKSPRDVEEMAAALEGLPERGSEAYKAMKRRTQKASIGMPADVFMEKVLDLYQQVISNRK